MSNDFLQELGQTALGSRLRRFLDRLNGPVSQLYKDELGFEQRWFALTLLLGRKGAMRVGDAASALGVSHVAIVQSVREMAKAGLVTKAKDRRDGRASLIALSAEGEVMLDKVTAISARVDRAAAGLLEEADPQLMATLDRLDGALAREGFAARLARAWATGAGAEKENRS